MENGKNNANSESKREVAQENENEKEKVAVQNMKPETDSLQDSNQPEAVKREPEQEGTAKALEAPEAKNEVKAAEQEETGDKSQTPAPKKKGKRSNPKKKHIGVLALCALVALLLLAYFGTAIFFKTHFLPNVTVNGMDCSYMTLEEAVDLIRGQSLEYYLEVQDQDGEVSGVIKASEIDLSIQVDQKVENLLTQQKEFKWLLAFFDLQRHDIIYEVEFDRELLKSLIREWDVFSLKNMEQAKDAYISEYSSDIKGYEIIPETRGSRLDLGKAELALINAVYERYSAVNLEEENCYIRAEITSEDANLNKKAAILNKWVGGCITYDWNGNKVVLDGDTVHEWIVEESGELAIDQEAVKEFVAAHAAENDTYGQKRRFRTTLGEELTLSSGAFGWKTDKGTETEELLELIQEGAVTDREPVYSCRGGKKGKDDIGSSYVELDLSNQHLYLYVSGEIILESDFVSGNISRGWGTPPGVFGLTYKTKNAVLRGENYETPVNYWMPFNGNVGMHDATWRANFGSDIYLTNGSHGCINLPLSIAKEVYSYISTGFPVICYYY